MEQFVHSIWNNPQDDEANEQRQHDHHPPGRAAQAASIRALLSGVSLAIRAPYPNKVFKTVGEALPWVEEQLRKAGYEDDATGVAAAVRAVGPKA